MTTMVWSPNRRVSAAAARATVHAVLLLAVGAVASAPAQEQTETTVTLRSGDKRVRVQVPDTSKRTWAAYTLARSAEYLPVIEEYLASPMDDMRPLTVVGEVEVRRDGRWYGGYADVEAGEVALQFDLTPIHDPSLLYHELGHFWFSGRVTDQAWLIEGVISFLPVAMAATGDEVTDSWAARPHFGFRNTLVDEDLPTGSDFRERGTNSFLFFYRKAFKIQYLILSELGPEGYRDFVRQIVSGDRVTGADAVLEILASLKDIDWRELLDGWVFPGPYRRFAPDQFEDRDHDGLLDVEEHYAGTDPRVADTDQDGLPDGAELGIGRDPLDADPEGLVGTLGPFVDGSGEEWDGLPAHEVTERAGDSSGDGDLDLVRMKYLVRDGVLFVLVETQEAPTPRSGVFFDVLRDSDADGQYDGDFAFYLDDPTTSWQYVNDEVRYLPGLRSAMGAVFEIAIPLPAVTSGDVFQILPILHNVEGDFNYDGWDRWVRISVR